jgi:hypothetical protein
LYDLVQKYGIGKYKKCDCPIEYWEVIIYDYDEDFNYKSTMHFHCDKCGIDWCIVDFYTEKVLYKHKKNGTQQFN